jgi:hypothetical protein
MPELIGAAAALDLMLTGRAIDGRRAKKVGLVDAVTPRRHFENAARAILMNPPPKHKPAFGAAVTNWPVVRNIVASKAAKQVAERARRDHYPAPYAIIETWRDFGGDVRNVPKDHPASMTTLFHHPTTRNLIRIFQLQDRLKALGKDVTPGAADAAMARGPNFPRPCDRSRGDGWRHRGVVRASWHARHAAGSRARADLPRGEARRGTVQETPARAAPRAGARWIASSPT